MRRKTKRIDLRLGEAHFKMLEAICRVDKLSKTDVLEDLIVEKFVSKSSYRESYYD